jgi:hypothetical protein
LNLKRIASFAARFWSEMAGGAKGAGARKIFKFITFGAEANWAVTSPKISSSSAHHAIIRLIGGTETHAPSFYQDLDPGIGLRAIN